MKKLLKTVMMALCAAIILTTGFAAPTFADNRAPGGKGLTCTDSIMGIPMWYSGLPSSFFDSGTCTFNGNHKFTEDEMAQAIWTVAFNVTGMIASIIGYVAVVIVMWGGYQYLLSQGDSAKAAKGKTTITNAVIGLAICALSSTITWAVVILSQDAGADANANIFVQIANRALFWSGIVAVVAVVVSGITFMASRGNSKEVEKAKNGIVYSVIGLIAIIFASAIVNLVLNIADK